MTWYTCDSELEQTRLLDSWPDAPLTNLEVCKMLLDVAKDQVIAYARTSDLVDSEGEPVTNIPARLVYAQLQQAVNLWNAGRVDSAGDAGMEYSYTPRPLDKTIRNVIRPIDGTPHVL